MNGVEILGKFPCPWPYMGEVKGPKNFCENQICGHNRPVTLWQKPLYDEIVPIFNKYVFCSKERPIIYAKE